MIPSCGFLSHWLNWARWVEPLANRLAHFSIWTTFSLATTMLSMTFLHPDWTGFRSRILSHSLYLTAARRMSLSFIVNPLWVRHIKKRGGGHAPPNPRLHQTPLMASYYSLSPSTFVGARLTRSPSWRI